MDTQLEAIKAHVAGCKVCTAANKRVNDFCTEGRAMFNEWAQHHSPTSAEEVELTDEQYERLVAERKRADKAGSN